MFLLRRCFWLLLKKKGKTNGMEKNGKKQNDGEKRAKNKIENESYVFFTSNDFFLLLMVVVLLILYFAF